MTVAASALSAAQCAAAGPICIVLEAIHHLEGVYPSPRTPTATQVRAPNSRKMISRNLSTSLSDPTDIPLPRKP